MSITVKNAVKKYGKDASQIYALNHASMEESAGNISMLEVLGYRSGEVKRLYSDIHSGTIKPIIAKRIGQWCGCVCVSQMPWQSRMLRQSKAGWRKESGYHNQGI